MNGQQQPHDASTAQRGVLSGYKVLELGVWIAAPAAAGILADWGAEVIKVESEEGDPQRHFFRSVGLEGARAPFFEMDNRGKRGVVLDLKTEEGLKHLHALIADADVFITNLRPRALSSLGIDPERLRAKHPELIYAKISGYGSTGPDADRAGYDTGAFWARSGAADRMALRGEAPPSLPPAFGDHITAITLVSGIAAALADRERSGKGRLVETSLLRTGMYCVSSDVSMELWRPNSNPTFPTPPRHKSGTPLMNNYATGDGRRLWLICLEADRHWPKVVEALGEPTWATDPRFATAKDRVVHRVELIEKLDETFAQRSLDEWKERLDAADVWFAPVNRIADIVEDPQAHAAQAFVEIPASGELDALRSPASPVDFDGSACHPRSHCPAVGEHTDEVLGELNGSS